MLRALPELIKAYIDNEGTEIVEDYEIFTVNAELCFDIWEGRIGFVGTNDDQFMDLTAISIVNPDATKGDMMFQIMDRDTLGETCMFTVDVLKLETNEFREKFGSPMYAD